jgi:hypothetical protein
VRLTLLPVAVAALIGLLRYRQLAPALRPLAIGIGAFLLPLGLLGLGLLLLHRNNLFIIPIYSIGELWMLALVYNRALQSPTFTRLWPWLVGGFAVYALLDSWVVSKFAAFRPSQQVMQSILVLGLVALYFRKLLSELRVARLTQEPMVWVSTGLLIYFLGYLQIALYSNYLLRYSLQLNMNIWAVHSWLFIVLYCFYSRALWLTPPK